MRHSSQFYIISRLAEQTCSVPSSMLLMTGPSIDVWGMLGTGLQGNSLHFTKYWTELCVYGWTMLIIFCYCWSACAGSTLYIQLCPSQRYISLVWISSWERAELGLNWPKLFFYTISSAIKIRVTGRLQGDLWLQSLSYQATSTHTVALKYFWVLPNNESYWKNSSFSFTFMMTFWLFFSYLYLDWQAFPPYFLSLSFWGGGNRDWLCGHLIAAKVSAPHLCKISKCAIAR